MSERLPKPNPFTTWVAKSEHIGPLVRSLKACGFEKMEMNEGAIKIYGAGTIRYFNIIDDNTTDEVIIEMGRGHGKRIVYITEGCKPIAADTFGGLTTFRIAKEDDLNS
jgi:hypothetical protein